MKLKEIKYSGLDLKTRKRNYLSILLFFSILVGANAQNQYLKSSISSAQEGNSQFSTESSHYKLLFGEDDPNIHGITRYASLQVDPQGSTKNVNLEREELIYFVLEGTGILNYDGEDIPISANDFFYIPSDSDHKFLNPREEALNILAMGFPVSDTQTNSSSADLKIASANDVSFQPMPGHGATSHFKLLLGGVNSKRDRIAAANQVTSLFIIDFDPEGTNIPHDHEHEEEIYFVLRGKGEMVAGKDGSGKELRHSAKKGDAFFIGRDTPVGFYSGNTLGEERAEILAVRFKVDDEKNKR